MLLAELDTLQLRDDGMRDAWVTETVAEYQRRLARSALPWSPQGVGTAWRGR